MVVTPSPSAAGCQIAVGLDGKIVCSGDCSSPTNKAACSAGTAGTGGEGGAASAIGLSLSLACFLPDSPTRACDWPKLLSLARSCGTATTILCQCCYNVAQCRLAQGSDGVDFHFWMCFCKGQMFEGVSCVDVAAPDFCQTVIAEASKQVGLKLQTLT